MAYTRRNKKSNDIFGKADSIFCLEVSDNFNTIEHIVSESLGNTDDILEKAVCDKCQNYFGREIENYILASHRLVFGERYLAL